MIWPHQKWVLLVSNAYKHTYIGQVVLCKSRHGQYLFQVLATTVDFLHFARASSGGDLVIEFLNARPCKWTVISIIWVSFCRMGKMSVLCPFFWKVESRCGQTKWYWWLLSICGDLIWLRGAFKVNFDLSFPRKPLFTALSTCPFCKI